MNLISTTTSDVSKKIMTKITSTTDGPALIHLSNGNQLIAIFKDGYAYSANLDALDPPDSQMLIDIMLDHVVAIERISDNRLGYHREMTKRRMAINDIQTALQYQQAMMNISKITGPIVVPQPEAPSSEPKKPSLARVPSDEGLVSPPLATAAAPKKEVKSEENYDGVVVEVPVPGE